MAQYQIKAAPLVLALLGAGVIGGAGVEVFHGRVQAAPAGIGHRGVDRFVAAQQRPGAQLQPGRPGGRRRLRRSRRRNVRPCQPYPTIRPH